MSLASQPSSSSSSDPWVECREAESGRVLFYHNTTFQIVFDQKPPPGVIPPNPLLANQRAALFLGSPAASSQAVVSSSAVVEEVKVSNETLFSANIFSRHHRHCFLVFCFFQGDSVSSDNPISGRDQLLDYKRTGWDFNNPRCEYFRAQAARYAVHVLNVQPKSI
jgi:hypothetical protein